MKKRSRLTLNEMNMAFVALTEEEQRSFVGGWYCFSYCLNYMGLDGDSFNQYYRDLYGDPQSNGGVDSSKIESTLSACGIGFFNPQNIPTFATGREIIAINDGTHAVIYRGNPQVKTGYNGKKYIQVDYYDPQSQTYGTYSYPDTEISMIHIN